MLEALEPTPSDGEATPTTRYEFLEQVGSGGMADVFRATDRELGRTLAIKLFRPEPGATFDEIRREREIRLLATLHHPGLVEIYDAGNFDDRGTLRRFIAMEFVDGPSLARRLKGGALTIRQVADIGAQIADALAYVHAQGIVHRDLKPDNILLDEDPAFGYTVIAKLADFGIAQFVDGTRLTNHDSILGTASYISPEQARGEEVGIASDIYSLGLVLLESITGEREYRGRPLEAALARLSRPPVVPADLPHEWSRLLGAMTAADPAERPTAHDVAVTMRDAIRATIFDAQAKHSRGSRRRSGAGDADARGVSPLLVGVLSAIGGLLVGFAAATALFAG